ncbi:hypothetical protein G159_02120 [Planococcus glaciei CHR43]|nr:hypothetical protein G159_02120 [Planococcus glaciei CHR43]
MKVEDFPYDKISSIQYATGIMFGNITIYTSGNKAEITQVDKAQTKNFAEPLRARISNAWGIIVGIKIFEISLKNCISLSSHHCVRNDFIYSLQMHSSLAILNETNQFRGWPLYIYIFVSLCKKQF